MQWCLVSLIDCAFLQQIKDIIAMSVEELVSACFRFLSFNLEVLQFFFLSQTAATKPTPASGSENNGMLASGSVL